MVDCSNRKVELVGQLFGTITINVFRIETHGVSHTYSNQVTQISFLAAMSMDLRQLYLYSSKKPKS